MCDRHMGLAGLAFLTRGENLTPFKQLLLPPPASAHLPRVSAALWIWPVHVNTVVRCVALRAGVFPRRPVLRVHSRCAMVSTSSFVRLDQIPLYG